MKTFTAVVEKCPQTGFYVGYVPGFVGAHSQGETRDELQRNLQEVIEMFLEDGVQQMEVCSKVPHGPSAKIVMRPTLAWRLRRLVETMADADAGCGPGEETIEVGGIWRRPQRTMG